MAVTELRQSSGSSSTTATSRSSRACPRSAWTSSARRTPGHRDNTCFNDDETECIVIEWFRVSDALIQHSENLARLMEAVIATDSVSGELLGEPSAALPARLTGSPVRLSTPWATM